MKVKLDKELEKAKAKAAEEVDADKALQAVKLLEEGTAQDDLRIFRKLGRDNNIAKAEIERGRHIDLERLENDYGKVFHIDQIKELAINYRLRFLSTQYFTGSFDVEVASKIREFGKETGAPFDDYALGRDYFVLAPAECFELTTTTYVTKKELDPVLFYRIDDNHFRMIWKWGKDFSIFRLLTGYRWMSWRHKFRFDFVCALPIITMLFSFLFSVKSMVESPIVVSIFIVIGSAIGSLIWNARYQDDWDQIRNFFSPWNWRSTDKIKR